MYAAHFDDFVTGRRERPMKAAYAAHEEIDDVLAVQIHRLLSRTGRVGMARGVGRLETVDLKGKNVSAVQITDICKIAHLDGLGIKLQTLLLVGQELLDILALITLELDHLSHLRVNDNGAIAGKLLLDDLENLLLIKLLGKALNSGQGLASIAFCCGG